MRRSMPPATAAAVRRPAFGPVRTTVSFPDMEVSLGDMFPALRNF
ncbi:hypothetical protein [Kribbella sp.]|nr:hypothetical protein [Kribbella sp.]HZX02711.1 hypothetical protein [Kribbella sp.]